MYRSRVNVVQVVVPWTVATDFAASLHARIYGVTLELVPVSIPDTFDALSMRRAIFFMVIGYSIYLKCSGPYVDWVLVLVLTASVYVVACHSL